MPTGSILPKNEHGQRQHQHVPFHFGFSRLVCSVEGPHGEVREQVRNQRVPPAWQWAHGVQRREQQHDVRSQGARRGHQDDRWVLFRSHQPRGAADGIRDAPGQVRPVSVYPMGHWVNMAYHWVVLPTLSGSKTMAPRTECGKGMTAMRVEFNPPIRPTKNSFPSGGKDDPLWLTLLAIVLVVSCLACWWCGTPSLPLN